MIPYMKGIEAHVYWKTLKTIAKLAISSSYKIRFTKLKLKTFDIKDSGRIKFYRGYMHKII